MHFCLENPCSSQLVQCHYFFLLPTFQKKKKIPQIRCITLSYCEMRSTSCCSLWMKMDLLFGLQMRCRINLFLSIRCEHCVVSHQWFTSNHPHLLKSSLFRLLDKHDRKWKQVVLKSFFDLLSKPICSKLAPNWFYELIIN